MLHEFRTSLLSRREALARLLGAIAAVIPNAPRMNGRAEAAELAGGLDGKLILPDNPRFGSALDRLLWNGRKPKRVPDVIVQAGSVDDVRAAVDYARKEGMRVSVRSGGHHMSGTAVRNGGMLIDVGALRDVKIDSAVKSVVAGPGIQNRELAAQLAEQGLAFPCGHCPTVTIGGYLLGGGFGWNAGAWGVACWNVTAVDIVTADGQLLHADERENADLFWAARGGGPGFFGVVVAYHLRAYDLPAAIETTTLVYPLEKTEEIVRWMAGAVATLRTNVEATMTFAAGPEGAQVCVVMATAFSTTHDEAVEALRAFATCPVEGILQKKMNEATPLDTLFDLIDSSFKPGLRYASDTLWLAGNPDELFKTAAGQYRQSPSSKALMIGVVMPPPPPDAPPLPNCAFSVVGPVYLNTYAIWDDETADGANLDWLRKTSAAFAGATIGHYVGEADLDADASRTRRSFSDTSWEQLGKLRQKYDPDGLFHAPGA